MGSHASVTTVCLDGYRMKFGFRIVAFVGWLRELNTINSTEKN